MFHHLGCHGHPLLPVIFICVNIIHVPVPCHGGGMTLQVLHILLSHFIQHIAWSGVFLATHICDFKSLLGCISCPWSSYSPGQLLNGLVYLLFEEACLGIFHGVCSVLFWVVWEILLSEQVMVMCQ